jgi:hypothetical protein
MMLFYVKLWVYVLGGVDYGPFEDEARCNEIRVMHERRAGQTGEGTCIQGWEERGRG